MGRKERVLFDLELRGHESLGGWVLGKHLLDPSDRLPCALFVLDKAEPHMPVAVVAEADARAYGYLGLSK